MTNFKLVKYFAIGFTCIHVICAVTMQQFEQSLDMMRNGCAPKFKIPPALMENLRNGDFTVEDPELKCYSRCVAQLAGTLTKKGDFSIQKALAQIPIILPPEMMQNAKDALNSCTEVQKNYKDSCDRVFFVTKCVRDYNPAVFKFP